MSEFDVRAPQLEAAILANPDDPAPYLVYADWLHQQGSDLGLVISLGHAASLDASKRPAAEQAARDYQSRRGLNEGVRLTWRMGVVAAALVTELGTDQVIALLADPALAFIRELVFAEYDTSRSDGETEGADEDSDDLLDDLLGDFSMADLFGKPKSQLTSLQPLAEAHNLRSLQLVRQEVHDLRPLSSLPRLSCLGLAETSVEDIEPLTQLSTLRILSVRATRVTDLSPLRHLPGLRALNVAAANARDLSPLATLKQLVHLDMGGTPLCDTDLDWLTGFTHLQSLTVAATGITRLTGFDQLVNLEELCLNQLDIRDITPLACLPQLRYLEVFSLSADTVRAFLVARARQPHADRPIIIVGADEVSEGLDEGFAGWIERRPRDDQERLWWLVR